MKRKFTIIAAAVAVFALGTSEIMLTDDNKGGVKIMQPTGISGYSSSGTMNCTTCHGGNPNSGGGNVKITSPDMTDFKYKTGQQYTIVVTVTDSKAKAYGLDISAVNSVKGKIGVFTAGTGTKVLSNEITHTAPSTSNSFTFKWTAPATAPPDGTITFYVSALAADNNGENTGDLTYTSNQAITLDNTGVDDISNAVNNLTIYPNPVAENINISYSIAKSNLVNINLIDLNGKTIVHLLNEKQSAGQHQKTFNLPSSISAGIYMVSIKANDATSYSKVTITR